MDDVVVRAILSYCISEGRKKASCNLGQARNILRANFSCIVRLNSLVIGHSEFEDKSFDMLILSLQYLYVFCVFFYLFFLGLSKITIYTLLAMKLRLDCTFDIIFSEKWPVESKRPKKLQIRCFWQFCINNDVTEADSN